MEKDFDWLFCTVFVGVSEEVQLESTAVTNSSEDIVRKMFLIIYKHTL